MASPPLYYLLLIDLRGSANLSSETASAVLAAAEDALERLNQQYEAEVKVTLSLSYGDEIAGIFVSAGPIYDVVAQLRTILRPYAAFRFVVTKGRMGACSADIRKIGGPLFKTANNALQALKRQGRHCHWHFDDRLESRTLTSLCELVEAGLEGMTGYQHDVYSGLKAGLTQKQVAASLKKYPQSVSDAVRRGHIERVLEAEQVIEARLSALDQ